jgi:hypothetical protein
MAATRRCSADGCRIYDAGTRTFMSDALQVLRNVLGVRLTDCAANEAQVTASLPEQVPADQTGGRYDQSALCVFPRAAIA